MTSLRPKHERRASEELISSWNALIEVPEDFWEDNEQKAIASSRSSLVLVMKSRPWMQALAACLVGGVLVWGWSTRAEDKTCVTFACLLDAQAEVPLTNDELQILEQWESSYDDMMFDPISFQ